MNYRVTVIAASLLAATAVQTACSSSSSTKDDPAATEATAESPDSGKSAREWFAQGNRHLDERQWEQAIDSYESALKKNSERADIYRNLGIARASNNDFEKAIEAFENALTHGGDDDPEVYYNLGNVYQQRGLYDPALKAYRTSLSYRDDLDVDTLVNIGVVLTVLDEREKAREAYERAQQLAPRDPRIQHGIATLLYLEQEPRQALDAYSQVHSMDSEYAPAYYDKARPLADLERWRDAVDALETYLEVAPDGKYADKAKGRLEMYRDKLGEAGAR